MDTDKATAKKRVLSDAPVSAAAYRRVQEELRLLKVKLDDMVEEAMKWRKKAEDLDQRSLASEEEENSDEFYDDTTEYEESMDEDDESCAPPAQKTCSAPAQVDVTCAPPAQKTSAKPALVEGPSTSKGVMGPNVPARGRAAAPRQAQKRKPQAARDGSGKEQKSKRVPVITIFNADVKDLTAEVKTLFGHADFMIRIVSRTVANFNVFTLEDYSKLKGFLVERKLGFYTYTPKGLTPFSVVVYGLSDMYSEEEVRAHLEGLPLKLVIQRVTKLGRDKWLIHLTRESDIESFYMVKGILNCRVAIKKDKFKRVTQCHNCQRFGHVSSNCGMPFRCVKCGGNHGPAKCNIPPKGAEVNVVAATVAKTGEVKRTVGYTLKCANCGVDGHAASSRDCPKRLAIVAKRTRMRKVRVPRSFPLDSGKVVNGMSFAAAAAGHSVGAAFKAPTRTGPKPTSTGSAMRRFGAINGDFRRLLGKDFVTCLNRVGNFSEEYDALSSDEEKTQALLGLLISINRP